MAGGEPAADGRIVAYVREHPESLDGTLQAIADALDVSRQRVHKALKDAGITRRVHAVEAGIAAAEPVTPASLRAWRERQGWSVPFLAARLGVKPQTVRRWEASDDLARDISMPIVLALALRALE